MGGALLQLIAHGAQDIYLTGNPQITFFKTVYRRHTNFAIEAIEQIFQGKPMYGSRSTCSLSRNGDLVHRMYIQATLPTLPSYSSWVPYVGLKLIKTVEIEIGGQLIDKHYNDWLYIWNELTLPVGKQGGYDEMVGAALPEGCGNQTIYIPLEFWFCRNSGLSLPLIALQYHEVKIKVEFEQLENVIANGNLPKRELDVSLWVDYIFLDTDERRKFAQLSHEMLIETVQTLGDVNLAGENNHVSLYFNHPVKELIWVTKPESGPNLQWNNYASTEVIGNDFPALYGGSNPLLDSEVATGWTFLLDSSTGDDDNRYIIPDIGFDLFLNGSNVRSNCVEIWSNFFLKFDGNSTEDSITNGAAYQPDNDTPSVLTLHYGSYDHYAKQVAYSNIVENGIHGIVMRTYGVEYNMYEVSETDYHRFIEVIIFEDGKVRYSTPALIDLYKYAGNWGMSDGVRWIVRIDKPQDNTIYEFSLYETPIPPPVSTYQPSAYIYSEDATLRRSELLRDLQVSYFSSNIIVTLDNQVNSIDFVNTFEILARPDMFVLSQSPPTGTDATAFINLLDSWIYDGTILIIRTPTVFSSFDIGNELKLHFTTSDFSEISPYLSGLEWKDVGYTFIRPNPYITTVEHVAVEEHIMVASTLGSNYTVLNQNAPLNTFDTYVTLCYKEIGNGVVFLTTGGYDGVMNFTRIYNDLYRYIVQSKGGTVTETNPNTNYTVYPWGAEASYVSKPIVQEANITLNGMERFRSRPGSYFNLVQPYQHHSRIPRNPGIYTYSFALEPEEHQPSGSLNMSRIDTAILNLKTENNGQRVTLKVFALSYNVLRIMSGMGGLLYSN